MNTYFLCIKSGAAPTPHRGCAYHHTENLLTHGRIRTYLLFFVRNAFVVYATWPDRRMLDLPDVIGIEFGRWKQSFLFRCRK